MDYTVRIEPLGQTIGIEAGQTLLDACLRQGVWLPHACCHGLCATCKVQVVDGEIEQGGASDFALMDFERDEGKCLACCATPLSDLVIEADIDEDPDALNLPLKDYAGTVVAIEDATPTIRVIRLAVEGGTNVAFQAGQYLNLHVPGCEEPRAFSLANAPHDGEIELHVRRVPGGTATGWLHESLQPGARLAFAAPFGRFFVRKAAEVPTIFLAGGSGLSSPKSMIVDLLEEGSTLPVTLIQGARSREELYCDDFFRALAAKHPNFHYLPALSDEPQDSAWTGERGFVHEVLKAHYTDASGAADFRGHKAYLCGPPPMIEACIKTLMQGRLFERDIYTEKFLSAADANAAAKSPLFRI
jgi:phenol/toluene 2-monooxygenase (NADH) P5/A5